MRKRKVRASARCTLAHVVATVRAGSGMSTLWRRIGKCAGGGRYTYIPVGDGVLFLAMVAGAFSRSVTARVKSNHLCTEVMLCALNIAPPRRRPDRGTHRSDGVSVHDSCLPPALRRSGQQLGLRASSTTLAMSESFFGTLEAELPGREHIGPLEQTRRRIFWNLQSWHILRRLHGWLPNR